MYHPIGFQPGHEFIELTNRGSSTENLENWATSAEVSISTSPARTRSRPAARWCWSDSTPPTGRVRTPSAPPMGSARVSHSPNRWTDGNLDNGGDLVRIQRPDTPPLDDPGYFPQIIEDISDFDDAAPWPITADGGGDSLHRVFPPSYGSQAGSWTASSPAPGTPPLDDDPDGDGISELLEYALNLDPALADADKLPIPIVEGDQLTYTYPKDTSKPELTYEIEVSSDLVRWTTIGDTLVSSDGDIELRKASVPLGGLHQFLRLKVSR